MSAADRVCAFAQLHLPGLGDLVQRNIMLALLRRAYPGAAVTLVVGASLADRYRDLLAGHLYADDVLRCPDPGDADPDGWAAFAAELAGRGYAACLVDPGSHTLSAAHARRAGIPVRIGFVTGGPADGDLTRPLRLPPPVFGFPDLYEYANALAQALMLPVPLRAAEVVPELPRRVAKVPELAVPGPRVAVHPGGATLWNRRWPPERYARLGTRLVDDLGAHLFLVGTAAERDDLDRLAALCPPESTTVMAGAPLHHAVNLLAGVDLLVGNDSGPGHLAAALGTPSVIVYGPAGTENMVARVYPRQRGVSLRYPCQRLTHELDRVADRRCEHACVVEYRGPAGPYPRCLTDLAVDLVYPAVLAQLRAYQPQLGGTHAR